MFSIHYWTLFLLITIAWIAVRGYICWKNRKFDWKNELRLLTIYVCIVVIVRMVYFPLHLVNGHIEPLVFDKDKILPFWCNLVPFKHMFDVYDGWKVNLLGNIAMFIPVGICLPLCFKKLDNIGKVTLTGFLSSLAIELSQLLFFDRNTDVDDLILNTTGVLIGAFIFFGVRWIVERVKKTDQRKEYE